jgi:hypothetical protein
MPNATAGLRRWRQLLALDRIAALCRQYRVRKLSHFGSVLRDDFRSGSDLDMLVFEPKEQIGYFGLATLQ